jgi:hypothetical protein
MTAPAPPPRDPRTVRHSTVVMARARELVEAGWTAGETRRLIAQEFGLDRLPSVTTIRSWTEPGYRELHRQWQLKCTGKLVCPPSALTPDVLLALRVDDGHSYSSIAAIARRFFGEEMTANQARYRLRELGAPRNANKVRATRRQHKLRAVA